MSTLVDPSDLNSYIGPTVVVRRHDFNAAVAQLEAAQISPKAADTLIYRAYTRGEPLGKWADHLVRVKRSGARVMS